MKRFQQHYNVNKTLWKRLVNPKERVSIFGFYFQDYCWRCVRIEISTVMTGPNPVSVK